MSIFNLVCAVVGGVSASPNIIDVPDGTTSEAYNKATAGIMFSNNGSYSVYYSGVPIGSGNWITPQTNISKYEIYATLDSGTTPDEGTQGSWLPLSTTRIWANASASGVESSVLTFQIRWTGDNSVQGTGTVTLYASADPAP